MENKKEILKKKIWEFTKELSPEQCDKFYSILIMERREIYDKWEKSQDKIYKQISQMFK